MDQVEFAKKSDLESIIDIYNHYIKVTAITFDQSPWTLEECFSWFQQFSESSPYSLWVFRKDSGEIAGFCSSKKFKEKISYQSSVEVSIYLDSSSSKRGIGGEMYQNLFTHLEHWKVHRAIALITLPNKISLNFHKKFGFENVGTLSEIGFKFDKYWDVGIYQKKLGN